MKKINLQLSPASKTKHKTVIDIKQFLKLDSERALTKYYRGINTTHIQTRIRTKWNSHGREIFSHRRCMALAAMLCSLFTLLDCNQWYIQVTAAPDKLKPRKYLQIPMSFHQSFNRLCSQQKFNIRSFKKPLVVTNPTKLFLCNLIEIPFLFNYPEIVIFSLKCPIAVYFSHHLDFSIISSSRPLLRKIEKHLDSQQITFLKW